MGLYCLVSLAGTRPNTWQCMRRSAQCSSWCLPRHTLWARRTQGSCSARYSSRCPPRSTSAPCTTSTRSAVQRSRARAAASCACVSCERLQRVRTLPLAGHVSPTISAWRAGCAWRAEERKLATALSACMHHACLPGWSQSVHCSQRSRMLLASAKARSRAAGFTACPPDGGILRKDPSLPTLTRSCGGCGSFGRGAHTLASGHSLRNGCGSGTGVLCLSG